MHVCCVSPMQSCQRKSTFAPVQVVLGSIGPAAPKMGSGKSPLRWPSSSLITLFSTMLHILQQRMTELDKRKCCLQEIQQTEEKYTSTLESIHQVCVSVGPSQLRREKLDFSATDSGRAALLGGIRCYGRHKQYGCILFSPSHLLQLTG